MSLQTICLLGFGAKVWGNKNKKGFRCFSVCRALGQIIYACTVMIMQFGGILKSQALSLKSLELYLKSFERGKLNEFRCVNLKGYAVGTNAKLFLSTTQSEIH